MFKMAYFSNITSG